MKVRDLLTLALTDCGAFGRGQTPTGTDINNALIRCNFMLSQWQKKRWLVYHLLDKSVVSTGAESYTVGPGGDIDMAYRPDKIEAAFFRQLTQSQPSQVDYPLELVQSREDYSRIALKQLTAFPQYIWYDAAYPLGSIYPWPLPNPTIYEVHILVKEVLTQFTLDAEIILPEEYYAAILYNLMVRLCEAYRIPQRPGTVALAKDALNVIRKANFQIARLQVDTTLVRPGIYNPYSDIVR